jgi:hypothetical protein
MQLKKLDLSENSLSFLPDNMSCLSKLEELNINGNVFSDTLWTIDWVATLPRLKALFINLNEEDQVDYIMKQLPDLEYLNGLMVERDEEEEEEEDETEQEEEDRREHSDQFDESPSNNEHLEAHFSSNLIEEEKGIEAPHQEDTPPKMEQTDGHQKSEIPLEELEKIAILYDGIRNLHKQKNPQRDQELAKDFDQYLQRVMKNLYQTVQNSTAPKAIKSVNILKAKFDLYDICLSKLNELVDIENTEIGGILGDIHGGVHGIVSSFYDFTMLENQDLQLNSSMPINVQKFESENKKLINRIK